MNIDLEGIRIPDSKLAREIMELVRDTEPPLLFHPDGSPMTLRGGCTESHR